jgi:hypothetical protein
MNIHAEHHKLSIRQVLVEYVLNSPKMLLLIVATIILLGSSLAVYANHRIDAQRDLQEQLDRLDKFTATSIVDEVENVCAQLGRAPGDEAELELLLGKPMPVVHDYGVATFIEYMPTGDTSFALQYQLWDTNKWVYDSKKSDKGWIQHWD